MKWFSLFLFAACGSLAGQSITSVEYPDGSPIPLKEASAALGFSIPVKLSLFIPDSAAAGLSRLLNASGYLDHKIELKTLETDSSSYKLLVKINPGPEATLRSLKITGEGVDSLLNGVRGLSFIEGSTYNEGEMSSLFAEILDHLEELGFPFARLTIGSITTTYSPDSSSLFADVSATLDRSSKAVISKIEISGNEGTSPDVILREINVKAGDIYRPGKSYLITARLNKLRFFEPVPAPEFYFNERDEGILKITVKETNTNNFDGVIGYIPPGQNEETGYLTGLVNISMRNLFGTGRNFSFKWQQLSRNSQELDLSYTEPWLLGLPLSITPRLYQRKQDTLYVDRVIELSAEYFAGENFSLALNFSSRSVIPTLFERPVFTVFNSTITTGGIGLRYDTRDDPISPTGGINFFSYFAISNKKINGPAEFITQGQQLQVNLRKITFDLDLYFEVFSRNIAAFGVSVREIQGDLLEDSDLFRLGGNSTLRGYREEQFRGNRVAWTNLEYRFLLTRRSYLFAFFDTGYYLLSGDNNRGIAEATAIKTGYGFGMSFETGIGLLSVSYALASGEGFSDGKIHFGIINQF